MSIQNFIVFSWSYIMPFPSMDTWWPKNNCTKNSKALKYAKNYFWHSTTFFMFTCWVDCKKMQKRNFSQCFYFKSTLSFLKWIWTGRINLKIFSKMQGLKNWSWKQTNVSFMAFLSGKTWMTHKRSNGRIVNINKGISWFPQFWSL